LPEIVSRKAVGQGHQHPDTFASRRRLEAESQNNQPAKGGTADQQPKGLVTVLKLPQHASVFLKNIPMAISESACEKNNAAQRRREGLKRRVTGKDISR
jgi:hypothetical protein